MLRPAHDRRTKDREASQSRENLQDGHRPRIVEVLIHERVMPDMERQSKRHRIPISQQDIESTQSV